MSIEQAKTLLDKIKLHIQAGDADAGNECLDEMKIAMIDFPATMEFLEIAICALELGVLLSVADHDLESFSRNVSQLKSHYSAATPSTSSSQQRCHILGLNLMHLLVENNLSEFHAELELLSSEEASTPYISFPINIERQLMVGAYDEVLEAGSHIPDPSYALFMDNLLVTVRDSIADCVEVSYKTMQISDAVKMMKFDSEADLLEYCHEFRDDWLIQGGEICFQPSEDGAKASDIPSKKLIAQTLSYATELERIV